MLSGQNRYVNVAILMAFNAATASSNFASEPTKFGTQSQHEHEFFLRVTSRTMDEDVTRSTSINNDEIMESTKEPTCGLSE